MIPQDQRPRLSSLRHIHATILGPALFACANADALDADCPQWQNPVSVGVVASPEITEASGLAASRVHEGVLWTHNDKGDSARLFALGLDASHQGELTVLGPEPVDWEDLASGPAPDGGGWLFVGDIGDNKGERESIAVWRVAEPAALTDPLSTDAVSVATLRYPDGAKDAETLLLDPLTDRLYVVTKSRGSAVVYDAGPFSPGGDTVLVRSLSLEVPNNDKVTGGDVSVDGSQILLRTDEQVLAWSRDGGETVPDALGRPPCLLPAPAEEDGEAVAALDSGYASLPEGDRPTLWLAEGP